MVSKTKNVKQRKDKLRKVKQRKDVQRKVEQRKDNRNSVKSQTKESALFLSDSLLRNQEISAKGIS